MWPHFHVQKLGQGSCVPVSRCLSTSLIPSLSRIAQNTTIPTIVRNHHRKLFSDGKINNETATTAKTNVMQQQYTD